MSGYARLSLADVDSVSVCECVQGVVVALADGA